MLRLSPVPLVAVLLSTACATAPRAPAPSPITIPARVSESDRAACRELAERGAAGVDERVTQDACAGQTLGVGETCSVTVSFSPHALGPWRATLPISMRGGATLEVARTATGVQA